MPTTRREALTVAAVTITLPMLQNALGGLGAKAPLLRRRSRPGSRTTPRRSPASSPPPSKPADLKDNEFTAVDGHALLITRTDKHLRHRPHQCLHPPAMCDEAQGRRKNPQPRLPRLAIQSRRHRRQSPRPHAAATFRHPHQRRHGLHRNRSRNQGRQRRQKISAITLT